MSVPDETFRVRGGIDLVKHAPAWFGAPEGRIALSSAASPPRAGKKRALTSIRYLIAGESAMRAGMQARAPPERCTKELGESRIPREDWGDWPTGVAPAPSRPQREVLTVTPRPMSQERRSGVLPLADR